jgi:hypothetical protein
MKKAALLFVIFSLALSGCMPGANPTLTDVEMATRVAAILTGMPTNTIQAPSVTPVTPAPVQPTPRIVRDTPQASNTPVVIAADSTETSAPQGVEAATETPNPETPNITQTPSETPEPSNTPSGDDPSHKLGAPTGTDPMDNPDKWTWPVGKDDFTSNGFKDGYMWLTGLTTKPGWVVSAVHTDDAYIEETARTEDCSGSDNYGIIFRVPVLRQADHGYLFAISCDGKYSIWSWDGKVAPNGKRTVLIDWKASKYIEKGEEKTNRLGVMAIDNRLILYINGIKVDEVNASTFSQGYLGVFVNPDVTSKFTVRVLEIKYWNNPKP